MKEQRRQRPIVIVVVVVMLLGSYAAVAFMQPLPKVLPIQSEIHTTVSVSAPPINWPATGQSAVSLLGSTAVATHGIQKPAPTASTAKVITALVVLQKMPLAVGEPGPTYTVTPSDVALYEAYTGRQGSVLPVHANEQLTEYQMLQAMMLPSANNIADSLAMWAYGSLPAYTAAANAYLSQHGLDHTHVGSDASGLSPDTTTTAGDLVMIGKLALANAALAQIVKLPQASGLPVVDSIKNVNFLLGNSGIVGIKTGNSDEAGGVFLGAATTTFNNKDFTIISAVVGTPDLGSALNSSLPFIQSAEQAFTMKQLFAPGQVVASYHSPWGTSTTAVTPKAIDAITWNGNAIASQANLAGLSASNTALKPGQITIMSAAGSQKSDLQLAKPVPPPTWYWRLLHPLRG